ncbi:Histidine kinase-, DNA gyrase B-, and HSP90-like ATPase [Lishizhenia tianjinensis]|uniref:histidine kinase n=1 Tax=Lishizhenia tianjinensis TaxID=477690 RepID=A0A1I7B9G8_9FLAO|nr:sensor histidine kinase [Lishizhenia tianjinensis]SFT83771.1 Histidine kinase-, DNA gyrase B-, and HSP90-like ATPase [Lishizhenia tianjinensis]
MSDQFVIIFSVITGTLLVISLLVFIIYFIILYRRKQEVFELEREQFKQAVLQAQIEMKEETLTTISRELHDNFGQVASLIKMNLSLLTKHVDEGGEENLKQSTELIKQHIQDIRSLSVSLKGENLNRFGLFGMIKMDVDRYEKAGELKIHLELPTEDVEIDKDKEIFMYRMVQEILNNVIKHAEATEVFITIKMDENDSFIRIEDNGKGFVLEEVNLGSGILNIKERCKFIGGSFDLKSVPGKGTTYQISI